MSFSKGNDHLLVALYKSQIAGDLPRLAVFEGIEGAKGHISADNSVPGKREIWRELVRERDAVLLVLEEWGENHLLLGGKMRVLFVTILSTHLSHSVREMLEEVVNRFTGQAIPTTTELLSLSSLKGPSSDSESEIRVFLQRVKTCLGSHVYQIFLDLMVQMRQGYRTNQPALVVEKFDLIKAILTRESPELRLQLDRYFPVLEAVKQKDLLEKYSLQQSSIQFQKWKINYQSRMTTHESSQTHKPSKQPLSRDSYSGRTFVSFPPLHPPDYFFQPESKKRKISPTFPHLQFQTMATDHQPYENRLQDHYSSPFQPSHISQTPVQMLRSMASRPYVQRSHSFSAGGISDSLISDHFRASSLSVQNLHPASLTPSLGHATQRHSHQSSWLNRALYSVKSQTPEQSSD